MTKDVAAHTSDFSPSSEGFDAGRVAVQGRWASFQFSGDYFLEDSRRLGADDLLVVDDERRRSIDVQGRAALKVFIDRRATIRIGEALLETGGVDTDLFCIGDECREQIGRRRARLC